MKQSQEQDSSNTSASVDYDQLVKELRARARALGFQQLRVSDPYLEDDATHLHNWLQQDYHGEMDYMAKHAELRSDPDKLLPGTRRIISCRMDYQPSASDAWTILNSPEKAYVSRYALGRDYHKLMRKRLAQLAQWIEERSGSRKHRAFVDSAPVLERAVAQRSGNGWIGKNTLLISSDAGSWFFLGEIYTDAPLAIDPPQEKQHCGSCQRCLDICPTGAFVKPWVLDARRCISYLTIELKGSIPLELRPLMGNRIFGCDDCQLVCPWNKFSDITEEDDFQPRHQLDDITLTELFAWSEAEFLDKTAGSAIRRAGYERWLRNIAVALGNASSSASTIIALQRRQNDPSTLVREHVNWALQQHGLNVAN